LDEQEYRETQADISGKFGGIGIEISVEDGVPKIIAPIDGTPAAKAHLEPGDLIVGIGGQTTQGMDSAKVINAIRGKPGSAVTLMISRGDKAPFRVTLQRDIIRAPSVTSELEQEGFGYVRISQFVDDTPRNFKDAIESLKRQERSSRLRPFNLDDHRVRLGANVTHAWCGKATAAPASHRSPV
jgi:carboxyl-terminal processing protease